MTAKNNKVVPVRFSAKLQAAGDRKIVRLPKAASKKLPSRGQVAVAGVINETTFKTVIEPDGEFGHWIDIDNRLDKAVGAEPGDKLSVELTVRDTWPEPKVPKDLQQALAKAPDKIKKLWQAITPMARWEWVRWVKAAKKDDTRARRVEVSISKMKNGKRRPCCFNLASCTDPELSKGGKLKLP